MSLGLFDILSILLILGGLVSFLGASVGLIRFPDFYTRMHAAGKGDTLSTVMILAGLALFALNRFDTDGPGIFFVAAKVLSIGVLIMLTSPASTHALMKAGFEDNVEPVGERDEMVITMPLLSKNTSAETATSEPKEEKSPAAKKKTPRKKAPTKKKSATAKKKATTARKTATKKVATKKATVKKKTTAKQKSTAKKTTTKKTTAKKATKKTTAKKKTPSSGRKKD